MIKRIVTAALIVAFTLPLHAGFSELARAIDGHRGVKRVSIPFLGLARVAVWLIEPGGVGDFQLATFEGAENLDPRRLQALMREKIGEGFTPLVQARSKNGEWSFIYARPSDDGERVELIVLSHDKDETVLVRVEADAEDIAKQIEAEPRRVSRVAER